MSVGTRMSPTPFGTVTIPWTDDFADMLSFCQDDFGYISPVSHRDIYVMRDSSGKETGHVEVFVRLSCFGKNIQTQFQVVHTRDTKYGAPKTQFLFKSNNAATTFQCQRYVDGPFHLDSIGAFRFFSNILSKSLKLIRQVKRN